MNLVRQENLEELQGQQTGETEADEECSGSEKEEDDTSSMSSERSRLEFRGSEKGHNNAHENGRRSLYINKKFVHTRQAVD